MSMQSMKGVMITVGLTVGTLFAQDRPEPATANAADKYLPDEPLTVVFRHSLGYIPIGDEPWRWHWSINSAGQAERTVRLLKAERRKEVFSAEQMAELRRVLTDERFTTLQGEYGPIVLHGADSTLTVAAGEGGVKTVQFYSPSSWASGLEKDELAKLAPAARVWLCVAGMVDPEAKVLRKQKELAAAVKLLRK